MVDLHVQFSGLDRAALKRTLQTLVRIGKAVANFTPTDLDNKVMEVLGQVVDSDLTYEAIELLLQLLGKSVSPEALKLALASL